MAGGHAAGLTKRQREVWELLRQGLTNEEIAAQLGISPDGVKYHVADILRRLQVRSRYEAALVEPVAARRSWMRALVPLPLLGKLKSHTLAYAASGAALAAVAAGIALLAWGVMRTHDDSAPLAAEPTPAHREQQVSFVRDGAIWLASPGGGTPQRFADLAPCGDFFPNLVWSPDGQHLVCYSAAPNTTGKPEDETLHIVVWDSAGNMLAQRDAGPTALFSLAWSPSGASLEYVTDHAISFMTANGEPSEQISGAAIDPAYYAADVSLASPLWSQDGAKFAYWLNADGHAHITELGANGAGDRPQIGLGGRPMAWVLNDSAMLIAENYQPPAAGSLTFPSYHVSLVDLATGTRQRRPELDNGVQFWLSPDRTRLAYLAPGLSVGLMDIASGKVTRVPNSHITYPSESIPSSAVRFNADGSALYWTNFDAGSTAWRADAQTGALTKVVQADGLMALAPDASQLLYAMGGTGGSGRLVTVRVWDTRSGEDSALLTYPSSALPPGTPYDASQPRDFAWRPAPAARIPSAGDTPGATRSYANPKYGYSLEYPSTYFDLGESRDLPLPTLDEKYFATADVPSPIELGLDDLWLSIRVIDNRQKESVDAWAARHPASASDVVISDVTPIQVGGKPAIQQIEDETKGPHESSYGAVTYVDDGDLILLIIGLTPSTSAFNAHADEYQAVVDSMRIFAPAATEDPAAPEGTSLSATAQPR